jgi:signal transduction histidine kinase
VADIIEKRRSLHRHIALSRNETGQLQSQLVNLQALANIGTVASMIAHEMNNILTPLCNYAQLALKNPTDTALARKALEKTAVNSGRAAQVLESLLEMAHGKNLNKEDCRLTLIVEGIFTCMCRDFLKDKIVVDIQIPEELTIQAVPVQLQPVLMNLILNAREAMMPKGGRLTIRASETVDAMHIEVADTGAGIARENISRIFEPFFTTKNQKTEDRAGAGMGLAFCRHIIDAHDGNITVSSRLGEGTSFIITLPKSG